MFILDDIVKLALAEALAADMCSVVRSAALEVSLPLSYVRIFLDNSAEMIYNRIRKQGRLSERIGGFIYYRR